MHRVDGADHVGNMFSEGPPGTEVTADILNALQEEIVGVILAAGIALSKPDNDQLVTAIVAIIEGRTEAAPTLAASWTAGDGIGGVETEARYWQASTGEIWFRGCAKRTGGLTSTIGTVPASNWPLGTRRMNGVMYDDSAASYVAVLLTVNSSGLLTTSPGADTNDIVFLDGLRYLAEQ